MQDMRLQASAKPAACCKVRAGQFNICMCSEKRCDTRDKREPLHTY